ncbi:prenyltransferase/squalene oxidase repeat-containing protein [Bythopirellula polymerisocia]|uniref:Prenyltransferase and squalene oxidase repeat protein n=1 Tax=Bythopirellula polymerisocia TaxID=2528003 RepID=A0A5C6CWZ3_9BACT|nr:prenyltransferase/squalene oxidase repeat-containing protein [Bythopirellula polymerisocia]TWU27536.1 Prenyltransferase and squalene oxidase repeat protein [Bythopirellula polymerisocia]
MNYSQLPPLAYWGLTSSTWMAMWGVLGAFSVLIVVLLSTRWANKRTWQKCAILSLWVHVLFAFLSITVRVITGAPESGEEVPIHIAVLTMEMPMAEPDPQEEIQPDWEDIVAPPLGTHTAEPLLEPSEEPSLETADSAATDILAENPVDKESSPPAPPLEAPTLLPAPAPEPENLVAENEPKQDDADFSLAEASPEPNEPSPIPPSESVLQKSESKQPELYPDVLPVTPPTAPSHAAIPDKYTDRFAENLAELATQRGGSEQTEKAVRAALGWLAEAQSENGGWDASRFGAGQERVVLGHNRGGAGAEADTGITGLAILAFLGNGNSHQHGSYRTEVAHGLEYLRQRQRADGSLYGDAQLFARTYCHSMATLAACEAYAMTYDSRLDSLVRAATSYSLAMQHPTDGGWRYRRGDTGDTSQLGWQLMALKSAELAGIDVPDVTWTRIDRFLQRVRRGNSGGLASYRPDSPASRTMTAEAWFCHQLLQVDRSGSFGRDAINEAVESLSAEMPSPKNHNLYYWYYATLALQQNQDHSASSAAAWESWNHALTTTLLTTQESDGSWNADTVWGGYGGRVYATALSALCLEVYYRYKPSIESGGIAGREGWQSLQR